VIRATFPTQLISAANAATGAGSRTVTGVAVPWNTPGTVSTGETVVFHPGSLDASARPVLLRDHDRTRPIGTVTDARDTGQALEASAHVSATRDGDDALVLAADGALPMFSVGAEPTDYRYDTDGTLHVTAATWRELSLLTIGAYDAARVASVTATNPEDPAMPPDTLPALVTPEDPDAPPVDPDKEPNPDIEPDEKPVETVLIPEVVPVAATRGLRPRGGGMVYAGAGWKRVPANPYESMGLAKLAETIWESRTRGPAQVSKRDYALMAQGPIVGGIQAALVDVTLVGTNNIGAMYRPGYQAELIDIVSAGAPLVEVLRQGDLQRGDYPNKTFTKWTTRPQVALQTAEKTQIASGPAKIDSVNVPVSTWATGNDISVQAQDFGSPSLVEDWLRAAAVDYAETIQTYTATGLLAAATPVATLAGDTFIQIVGKLVGAMNPASVPPGGLFLAVSYDVWAGLISVTQANGPAFWSGSVSIGTIADSSVMGGLSVFYSPDLPAKTYLLGSRNAATWYDLPGTPFNVRAVNVNLLGLDVGLYGYGALGVQYPAALVKTTQP
jgi:phage head maturation protease